MTKFIIVLLAFCVIGGSAHLTSPSVDTEKQSLALTVMRHYNPSAKQDIAEKFTEMISTYGLDDNFHRCLAQICHESSVNDTVISKGGAVGLAQITPTTAFDILHGMNSVDRENILKAGAKDIEWATEGNYTTVNKDGVKRVFLGQKLRAKAIGWLKDPVNNLALWAHITSSNLSKMSVDKAFLAYNLGPGGIRKFSGRPSDHPYIRKLNKISTFIQTTMAVN